MMAFYDGMDWVYDFLEGLVGHEGEMSDSRSPWFVAPSSLLPVMRTMQTGNMLRHHFLVLVSPLSLSSWVTEKPVFYLCLSAITWS